MKRKKKKVRGMVITVDRAKVSAMHQANVFLIEVVCDSDESAWKMALQVQDHLKAHGRTPVIEGKQNG